MTFANILTDIYADLGYQSAPAAAVIARIKRYVNEGLRVILGEPTLQRLNDSDIPHTFASVANQARYVMTDPIARIHAITERTNDRVLDAMSLTEYRRRAPDPTSVTGVPTHYVPIGIVGVMTQPSAATEVFVDSTSALDVGTAYLEGILTGGYRRRAQVTMTGVTGVSLDSTLTTWEQIEDFYISTAAAGTVTLQTTAVGGTTLATITIGQTRPRYYGIYLWPTPSAAVTYYVDYRRDLVELGNDTDEPSLPADYHYLLSAYARMRHWEKEDDARFKVALAIFQQGLSRLKYSTQSGPDEFPVAGRAPRRGYSRLGGWYPADTWR